MEKEKDLVNNSTPVVKVDDLVVHYETRDGVVEAVNGVSFEVGKGETLGLVGETGAGKTTIALSILGLLPVPPSHIIRGTIEVDGEDISKKSKAEMRKIRGKKISMIFQDPMTALNPVVTIGDQIAEVIMLHADTVSLPQGYTTNEETVAALNDGKLSLEDLSEDFRLMVQKGKDGKYSFRSQLSRADAERKAGDMLEMAGIRRERYKDYPHQLSGGMKQRVVIAIALACNPELLIADEPTTALDVTIQAQVLDMIKDLRDRFGTSMILITHDFGIVAQTCDRCAVVYGGEIIEMGSVEDIFDRPQHPYTIGLFDSIPSLETEVDRLKPIMGQIIDPTDLPEYCSFSSRCGKCTEDCKKCDPKPVEVSPGHFVKCIYAKKEGE